MPSVVVTSASAPPKSKLSQTQQQEQAPADAKVPDHLWRIHGRLYDMEKFVESHPGGSEFILLGKGRDCTELFESVHALSNVNIRAILAKYEVKDAQVSADLFAWEENGFYRTLVRRVREHFARGQPDGRVGNYKANVLYWSKAAVMTVGWLFAMWQFVTTGSWVAGFWAGLLMESMGFNALHDGSHGGISKGTLGNRAGILVGEWALWDTWLWLTHHVWAHHSFTGMNRRDPDMNNAKAFMRKHPEGSWKRFFRWQHLYVWPIMMIFPAQHIGQVMQYVVAAVRGRLFGVPLVHGHPKGMLRKYLMMATLSLTFHLFIPMYLRGFWSAVVANWFVWMAAGMAYFFTVVPNHDSPESAIENHVDPRVQRVDWGEQQVRCSGNHSVDQRNPINWLVTHMFGGMNLQIEHHLFPSVSNVHLSTIQPIVEKTCGEFNIPYNAKPSWWAAVVSYYQLLRMMGNKNAALAADVKQE